MVNFLLSKSKKFLQSEHNSILSAALIIGASFLLSALLGLFRNHLLASRFFGGFEADLDVYFAAFVIPDTIFQLLIVGAISAAFIPVFQEYNSRSKAEAYQLTNATLTLLGLILTIFSLGICIFARPLAGLIANFSPDKLDLMANLIRLMSIAQILFTFSSFLTGILQAQRRFLIPAIAPLFYNLGTILGIITLSSSLGIYSAAVGVVFGALLHCLIQLPLSLSLGFRLKFVFRPKDKGVLTILKLMPPRTVALGLDQIERWVAVNLTSLLAAGSLSIFNFARQLYVLPISLFGVSLSQASFPTLAEEAVKKDLTNFRLTLAKSISQIFFFALPASVLILVLRIPLVRLAFGAKAFPWEATLVTGKALAILSLGIAPQAVTHVLTRAFHALKNTRTPLFIGATSMIIFICSSIFVVRVLNLGILGLTLTLTIGNFVDFFLLYVLLHNQIGKLGLSFKVLKMTLASTITGISLWLPMRLLDRFVFDTTRTIPLILLTLIVSAVGFLVYLFFCHLLRIEELEEVRSIVRKIGNWRKIFIQTDEVIETPPQDQ